MERRRRTQQRQSQERYFPDFRPALGANLRANRSS